MSEACEKQLATQHRLAPGLPANINTTTEGSSVHPMMLDKEMNKFWLNQKEKQMNTKSKHIAAEVNWTPNPST